MSDQKPPPPDETQSLALPADATETFLGPGGGASQSPTVPPGWDALTVGSWSVGSSSAGPQPPKPEGPAYTLREQVGMGGFGEVWSALQGSLGRVVAVKRLRSDHYEAAGDIKGLEHDFRLEALTTASLDHPNIVPVHDLGTDEAGRPLIAMKLVRGEPWNALIARDFPAMSAPDFLAQHLPILIDVANAVAFAHSRGVVHRDLKPQQVMVGRYGEVLLMDWGLALHWQAPGEKGEADGGTVWAPLAEDATSPSGTPAYMAPEQTESTARHIGPWTDVYLLGGTLYQLLTGAPPHRAASSREAFQRAMEGRIDPPEDAAEGREIPAELAQLAMQALDPIPANRVASAEEFVAGLIDYLSGAGKRREAQVLLTDAEALLAGKPGYRKLSRAIAALERAGGLWPGNALIASRQEAALELYARRAVELGDLALASQQLERLAEGPARAALLDEVADKRARLEALSRQRRAALAAAAVLALVVILGGSYYAHSLRVERDAAQEARSAEAVARAESDVSRQNAEGLLNFMLTDLATALTPLGQLDLLDGITDQAFDYFASAPHTDDNTTGTVQQAYALMTVSKVLSERGRVDESINALVRAEELVFSAAEMVLRRDHLVLLLKLLGDRMVVESRGGHPARGRATLARAEPVAETLSREFPRDPESLLARGAYFNAKQMVMLYSANIEGQAQACREGSSLLEELRAADADEYESAAATHLQLMTGTADALFSGEKYFEAIMQYEAAYTRAEEVRATAPENSDILHMQSTLASRLGYLYLKAIGDPARALPKNQAGVEIAETLHRVSPGSAIRLRDLAVSQVLLAMNFEDLGQVEAAYKLFAEACSITEALTRIAPANRLSKFELAERYHWTGMVARKLERGAEAIDWFESAHRLIRELRESGDLAALAADAARFRGMSNLSLSMRILSQTHETERRWPEALASIGEAISILTLLDQESAESAAVKLDRYSATLARARISIVLGELDAARTALEAAAAEYDWMTDPANSGPLQDAGNQSLLRNLRVVELVLWGRLEVAAGNDGNASARFLAAIDVLESTREEHPFSVATHVNYAESLARVGRREEAAAALAQGIDTLHLSPTSFDYFEAEGFDVTPPDNDAE